MDGSAARRSSWGLATAFAPPLARWSGRERAAAATAAGLRPLWIVVTSDHGEHFLEHGLMRHANSLFEPLLRVPLALWGVRAGSDAPDSSEGTARFLAARLLGAAARDTLARGSAPEGSGLRVHARTNHLCVRSGELKVLLDADAGGRHVPVALYDLAADPEESANLLAERPEQVEDLQQRLEKLLAAVEPVARTPDEDQPGLRVLAEMEALGYVEGGRRRRPGCRSFAARIRGARRAGSSRRGDRAHGRLMVLPFDRSSILPTQASTSPQNSTGLLIVRRAAKARMRAPGNACRSRLAAPSRVAPLVTTSSTSSISVGVARPGVTRRES